MASSPSGAGTTDVESTEWFLLAGVANTMFLLGYYVALTIVPANLLVSLIVTNTFWAVALSALVMPERFERVTLRLAAAALGVVAGVAIVSVAGRLGKAYIRACCYPLP